MTIETILEGIDDDEELFQHVLIGALNVSKLQKAIDDANMNTRRFEINDPALQFTGLIGIDYDHVANMPEERAEVPGIMVKLPNGVHLMVDGHHRQAKRSCLHKTDMEFYVVPWAFARRFRCIRYKVRAGEKVKADYPSQFT